MMEPMIAADVRGEQQSPQLGSVTHVIKVRVEDLEAQFEKLNQQAQRSWSRPLTMSTASVTSWSKTLQAIAGSSGRPSETSPLRSADARRWDLVGLTHLIHQRPGEAH